MKFKVTRSLTQDEVRASGWDLKDGVLVFYSERGLLKAYARNAWFTVEVVEDA